MSDAGPTASIRKKVYYATSDAMDAPTDSATYDATATTYAATPSHTDSATFASLKKVFQQ